MNHVIRKQIVDLTIDHRLDAFKIQHAVSSLYWNDVVQILEFFFNEVSKPGESISIDNLEIDLGMLSEKDIIGKSLNPETGEQILKQLRERLISELYSNKGTLQTRHESISICQQWLFYMQKGYLSWNAIHIDQTWKSRVLEALAVDYICVSALREIIVSDEKAVSRIIHQHKDDYLVKLVEILTAESQNDLLGLLSELEYLYCEFIVSDSKIRKSFWRLILKEVSMHQKKMTSPELAVLILTSYLTDEALAKAVSVTGISKFKLLYPLLLDGLKDRSVARAMDKQNGYPSVVNVGDESSGKYMVAKGIKDNNLYKESFDQQPALNDEIFADHAGVILVHPFLALLFNKLDLVKDGKFFSEAKQHKALYIIHYLATGRVNAEEYELVIPKVLCSFPISNPVISEVYLTDDELEECDHMLHEVINKWQVLKNTSVDGLRQGFLARGGKLAVRNSNVSLQMEAGPLDVLLDRLPWTLSLVKLPWMKELIKVDWR